MTVPEDEFQERPALVRQRVRVEILDRVWKAVLLIFVILALGISAVNAVVSIDYRQRLLDCTVPEGQCAQEGQERTAEAIQSLIQAGLDREEITRQVVVAAAACADQAGVDTEEEIQKCVDKKMEE